MLDNQTLANHLKTLDLIPTSVLNQCLEESTQSQQPLSTVLVEHDAISDTDLGKLMANILGFPYVQLSRTPIDQEILTNIPEIVAQSQQLIAFSLDQKGVHVAMTDPTNEVEVQLLTKKFGQPIIRYFTSQRELDFALNLYHQDMTESFTELIQHHLADSQKGDATLPIVSIIDLIIEHAYFNKASDIHFEPERDQLVIRFRIDGILHEVLKLPSDAQQQIVARIKVMARLRTDELQASQDGKINHQMPEEDLDLRVSIVPVTHGEKVVMRLLSSKSRQFGLLDLGFSEKDRALVEAAFAKPHGMILATGPTGSGKTTTLYAILKLLNSRDRNIMTIEDPVEYDLAGINQIQVNPQTNLTFADGLRTIVRQDPDVILVGEIRDDETADIAVNAALTGHLVLSTLHTNDAATSLPRLLDLGIEPYLVASTVSVIVGQRLVRTICHNCRVSDEKNKTELSELVSPTIASELMGNKSEIHLYKGKGCAVCHQTGYAGRIGIFEVLVVDDELRTAIVEKKDTAELQKLAVKQGMTTMLQDGLQKALHGLVTIEEVLRVTRD